MRKLLALTLFACVVQATPVIMLYRGTPGTMFNFLVDGRPMFLVCDNFNLTIPNEPFVADMISLSDNLSGTLLGREGDPEFLQKYQQMGILYFEALANPLDAPDIALTIRAIGGETPFRGPTIVWHDWVLTQNPANYPLSYFRIFVNPLHQEQVGGELPEPAIWPVLAMALLAVVYWSRRQTRAVRVNT